MSDFRTDDAPLSASKQREATAAAAEDLPQATASGALVGWSVTINRPVGEVYSFFRDFSNLQGVMENVERVDMIDARRSHWVVKAPAGRTVEWDARITEESEDEVIAWTSEEGADVSNAGRVTFRDADARGTVVTSTLLYDPPGGAIGKLVAKLFQREPAIQARRDLRRFKMLMETGEIATRARNRRELEEEQR